MRLLCRAQTWLLILHNSTLRTYGVMQKILILQNEIPETVNIAAARNARRHGVQVCINATPWRALSSELIALLDIVVVNAVEAEDMGGLAVGDLISAERAAVSLTKLVETAIVTVDGDGVAWARRGQAPGKLMARPVEVVSTHGAGDIFIGSLCHHIAQNALLEASIEIAHKAAANRISNVPI